MRVRERSYHINCYDLVHGTPNKLSNNQRQFPQTINKDWGEREKKSNNEKTAKEVNMEKVELLFPSFTNLTFHMASKHMLNVLLVYEIGPMQQRSQHFNIIIFEFNTRSIEMCFTWIQNETMCFFLFCFSLALTPLFATRQNCNRFVFLLGLNRDATHRSSTLGKWWKIELCV